MKEKEFKQLVYDLMTGVLDLSRHPVTESQYVQNEFHQDLPCDNLYQEVYLATRHLCAKLGVEEDDDVEIILSNMMRIQKILCMKMYEYGVFFANRTFEEP